jgi:hypothetical protein
MISFTPQRQLNLISHPHPYDLLATGLAIDSNPPPCPHPILLLFPPWHLLSPISHPFLCSNTNNLPHEQETSLNKPALSFLPKNRKSSEIVRHEAVQEAPVGSDFATIGSISGRDGDKFL